MSPPARDAALVHIQAGASALPRWCQRAQIIFCTSNRAVFKSFLVLLCCSFFAFKIIYLFKDTTYNFVLLVTRALKKSECQD